MNCKKSVFLNIAAVSISIIVGTAVANAETNNVPPRHKIYVDPYLSSSITTRTSNQISVLPQIRQWELNSAYHPYTGAANRYIAKLPNTNNPSTNPIPGIWATTVGGNLYHWRTNKAYDSFGKLCNNIANTYRSAAAASANRIADTHMLRAFSPNSLGGRYSLSNGGIYVPNHVVWYNQGNAYRGMAKDLRPATDIAIQNATRGWAIYDATLTTANIAVQSAEMFLKTIDYVGTSMQIMNPPIYLQDNYKFTPAQKFLFIPTAGIQEGYGSYAIPGGAVHYTEKLDTSFGRPITQIHNDWGTTNFGNFNRRIEISTPAVNSFERFAVTHYPANNYWDPKLSTMSYRETSFNSWREVTKNGYTTVIPINQSQFQQRSWQQPVIQQYKPPPTYNYNTSYNNYNYNNNNYNSKMKINTINIPSRKY